jgi:hypothetical protein
MLPEDIQPIVAPYLTTKFTLGAPKPSNDPMRGEPEGGFPGQRLWRPCLQLCATPVRFQPSSRLQLRPAPPRPSAQPPSSAATSTHSAAGCTSGCAACAAT